MTERRKPNPTAEEAQEEDRPKDDERSSLDRLADFAKRVLAVPKSEIGKTNGSKRTR